MSVQRCFAIMARHASSRRRSYHGDIMQSVAPSAEALAAIASKRSAGTSSVATAKSYRIVSSSAQSMPNEV